MNTEWNQNNLQEPRAGRSPTDRDCASILAYGDSGIRDPLAPAAHHALLRSAVREQTQS